MTSSWKSLIFDFDNTLVASSIDFRGLKQEIITLLHQNDLSHDINIADNPPLSKLAQIPIDFGSWCGDTCLFCIDDEDIKYANEVYQEWLSIDFDLFRRMVDQYSKEVEKCPSHTHKFKDNKMIFPKGSLREKVNLALIDAVKDMLRPVNIRDWYINIQGGVATCDSVDGEYRQVNKELIKRAVKPYKYAGYGLNLPRYEKGLRE